MNILKLGGYALDLAGNGEEALEKVKSFQPDLVVLDVVMPKMNGVEVLVSMKTNPETEHIDVIVFTNAYTNKSVESAKALGVKEFLLKSNTEPEALLEVVARVLAERTKSS